MQHFFTKMMQHFFTFLSEKHRQSKVEILTFFKRKMQECNTRSRKSDRNALKPSHRYVLTYINNMLTHINGICLHISAKSCTFAVENELSINPKSKKLWKRKRPKPAKKQPVKVATCTQFVTCAKAATHQP